MTSRERLLRTFRREPVDRVPISTYELNGHNPDSFENRAPSYRRLMDKIRADTDCIYMWGWDPWVDSDLWQHREEAGPCSRVTVHSRLRTPLGDLTCTRQRVPGVHTTWVVEHLLKTPEDAERYLRVMPDLFQLDEDKVRAAREDYAVAQERVGDHGVVMNTTADPSCMTAELFELRHFCLFSWHHRDLVAELVDAFARLMAPKFAVEAEYRLGDVMRICGPEYYTPPFLPPDHFEQFVVPYCRDIVQTLESAGIFPRLHCHGRIREVLPHIVATGARGLDPIEPPPDGDITLGEVKEKHGDRLVLFGNTELKALETLEPNAIDALVKQQMDEGKPGGGYVLMPTAAPISEPLSPKTEANYFAWIDAGLRYGAY